MQRYASPHADHSSVLMATSRASGFHAGPGPEGGQASGGAAPMTGPRCGRTAGSVCTHFILCFGNESGAGWARGWGGRWRGRITKGVCVCALKGRAAGHTIRRRTVVGAQHKPEALHTTHPPPPHRPTHPPGSGRAHRPEASARVATAASCAHQSQAARATPTPAQRRRRRRRGTAAANARA